MPAGRPSGATVVSIRRSDVLVPSVYCPPGEVCPVIAFAPKLLAGASSCCDAAPPLMPTLRPGEATTFTVQAVIKDGRPATTGSG
jgi:hypothetical protein